MRLFIAIELSEAVKAALKAVQDSLGEFTREVRWARPEQIHLTLKFLGEVLDDQVEAVCAAAASVAGQTPPFEITLEACGCFPPRGAVRIVHCAVADRPHTLPKCNELCEGLYADLGFEREARPFRPHLTIGRVREDHTGGRLRAAVERTSCAAASQAVERLCVVQSVLDPTGARYSNVAAYGLGGG